MAVVATSTAIPQNRNSPAPPGSSFSAVYILNKQPRENQKVIEVPAPPPSEPEVYFINYAEGENPILPNGIDLQTALNAAIHGNTAIVNLDEGIKQNDSRIATEFESTRFGGSFTGKEGGSSSNGDAEDLRSIGGNIGFGNTGGIGSRFDIGANRGVESNSAIAGNSGFAGSVVSVGNGVSDLGAIFAKSGASAFASTTDEDVPVGNKGFINSGRNENSRITTSIPRLYSAP